MDLYDELLDSLCLKLGDIVWLSSDIIKLSLIFKSKQCRFDGNYFIDCIQKKIGEEGTLLIPVFKWDLDTSVLYDVKKTKGSTGALGNLAMKRSDFTRTKHPMHSFMVWGKDKEYLCNMENYSNFGKDSPFEYCKQKNVTQIMLGTDFVHAMTFIHYVEVMCHVPYRYEKVFSINVREENGSQILKEYKFFPKSNKVGSIEKFNRMGDLLLNKKIAKDTSFYGCKSYIVHLGESYPVIEDDIKKNQCRNLFDFKIDRSLIF